MFMLQAASRPPSSRDSPKLCPEKTRSELELSQEHGLPPPEYTPSLHRSLRSYREQHKHVGEPAGKQHAKQEGEKKSAAKKMSILFRPRTSILDYTELMYQGSDTIRGLVTCFWTIVGAYLVSILASHYERNGELLSGDLAVLLTSRGKDLLLSDLALVASTFFVVPFVRLLWAGSWQPYFLDPRNSSCAIALHAAVEVSWLVFWYGWQGTRGWPWTQRCFFSLHTAVNWMKIHSYLSTNRHLACVLRNKEDRLRGRGSCKEAGEEIQEEIKELDAQLCPYSNARFPQTLTTHNYFMFQLCPTLVYELEYPRTPRIRWLYVAEKMAGTAGIFIVFYVVVAHLMIPHLERMSQTGVLMTTVHLMGPMATCWLLFFFITFDSISNGFAELTRFADRRFYDDWWNARGLDEFSRKWNRPVHLFLARHIYMPIRDNWRIYKSSERSDTSKEKNKPKTKRAVGRFVRHLRINIPAPMAAMAATFFFSSILHEVTVVVACHRWNHGVLFFSQMMQIPLIFASDKMMWYKNQHALRNWIFWLVMVFFQPFLLCLYTYNAFVAREDSALTTTIAPSVNSQASLEKTAVF
ncbi:Sterol O-acyltransferase 2 (Sterol-ester synthase 2) [Coemansia sp. RSA 1813]|nr:Sterol O-acyltransferase 2 (Sterol-ester synthase 2) [Coemansia sp. RSA 1843]KAJ2216129.1 Sterol O-acyltransferase 2 (Sterol-ester synthase 2) [Coemansia sp. RSA 487]KAJ2570116.1 Sterol O-acyltransferase 2 (Sterol-ester synthase 2) [Coemansia sp. RSA 1813]